jgi:hypothetical protein
MNKSIKLNYGKNLWGFFGFFSVGTHVQRMPRIEKIENHRGGISLCQTAEDSLAT